MKNQYDITTWSTLRQTFTPQRGVRRGPYTLMGLRRASVECREPIKLAATDRTTQVERMPKDMRRRKMMYEERKELCRWLGTRHQRSQ